MEFMLRAFSELCTEMREGQIPWSSIHLYATTYGFTGKLMGPFVDAIRAMEEHVRKSKKGKTIGTTPSVPPKPRKARKAIGGQRRGRR